MENNTETNQVKDLSNPQDSLNAALIFARALSLILQENQGIVVDVNNKIDLGDDSLKVIVFKNQEQIHIYKCEEDLEEGLAVMMNEDSKESEEKN
jgi:hypothetical protein